MNRLVLIPVFLFTLHFSAQEVTDFDFHSIGFGLTTGIFIDNLPSVVNADGNTGWQVFVRREGSIAPPITYTAGLEFSEYNFVHRTTLPQFDAEGQLSRYRTEVSYGQIELPLSLRWAMSASPNSYFFAELGGQAGATVRARSVNPDGALDFTNKVTPFEGNMFWGLGWRKFNPIMRDNAIQFGVRVDFLNSRNTLVSPQVADERGRMKNVSFYLAFDIFRDRSGKRVKRKPPKVNSGKDYRVGRPVDR